MSAPAFPAGGVPPAARRGHGGMSFPGDVSAYLARSGADPLTGAFARRGPVMPFRGAMPIAESEAATTFGRATNIARDARSVAYVHVPFCHNHCLFCGFYQNPWQKNLSSGFVDALVLEISQAAQTACVQEGPPIEAVYLGGGTPTALDARDITRLIRAIRDRLPLAADCEITLEGRVHDFGVEKARAAIEAGANRISLGIQCFDTRVRRRLGRKSDMAMLIEAIGALTELDSAAIVIDLMYGLPGQDEAVWQADIARATRLDLDGLDVYALNVWPGGPLAGAIEAGKALPLPGLADQARAYAQACRTLEDLNWRHISHAHFARTPRERNIYNRMVKEGAICLAFGPGAGGFLHGLRWRNITALDEWSRRVARGEPVFGGLSRVSALHHPQTMIVAGLERGVLDLGQLEAAAPGFLAVAGPLLANWKACGLLALDGSRAELTLAGHFWMTTLTAGLHAALDAITAPAGAAA